MKLLLPILLAFTVSTFAQTPSSSPSPAAPSAPPAAAPAPESPRMPSLSPGESQTLMNAMQKAQQDPAVQTAGATRQQAMKDLRAAMIAKDPTLAPVFEKLMPATPPAPGSPRPKLTAAESMQFRAAQQAMQGTPEFDAYQSASRAFAAAMRAAMLAADPAVADIIAKIPQMGGSAPHAPAPVSAPAASASPKP